MLYRQYAADTTYGLTCFLAPRRYPKFARVLLWLLLEVAIVGEGGEEGREEGRGGRQPSLLPPPGADISPHLHLPPPLRPFPPGADIQETIGSAIALSILTGGALPLWLGCIFISITAFLLLLLDRFGFR